MSIGDKFQQYLNNNEFDFEGEGGVRNLEQVVRDIGGYNNIRDFLADNPGACEALIEFVEKWIPCTPEWKEALETALGGDEDAFGEGDCLCHRTGLGGNDPDNGWRLNRNCPIHGEDPDYARERQRDDDR